MALIQLRQKERGIENGERMSRRWSFRSLLALQLPFSKILSPYINNTEIPDDTEIMCLFYGVNKRKGFKHGKKPSCGNGRIYYEGICVLSPPVGGELSKICEMS
jgi:hypothetical protein